MMNASHALYSIITSTIIRNADQGTMESFLCAIAILLTFMYMERNCFNDIAIVFNYYLG
jgi:hypothetical protein